MQVDLGTPSLNLCDEFDRQIEQATKQIEGLERRRAGLTTARAALYEVIKYEQDRD